MCHATSMGRSVDRTDLLSSIWMWQHLSQFNSFYNTKTAIHFQSFLPHNAAARRSAPVVGPAGPGPRAPAESRQRCLSMFAYVYACNRSLVIPSISLLIKFYMSWSIRRLQTRFMHSRKCPVFVGLFWYSNCAAATDRDVLRWVIASLMKFPKFQEYGLFVLALYQIVAIWIR